MDANAVARRTGGSAVEGGPAPPVKKPSQVFEPPHLSARGQVLSDAEIEFFVEHGFLVKKRLLAASGVDAALDRAWRHLLENVPLADNGVLRQDDPGTWVSPRWAPMPPTPQAGPHEGRAPLVYSGAMVRLHDLGAADFLVRLVPNNPRVRRVATTLLGVLRPSHRTRGVYALFPTRQDADEPDETEAAEARVADALLPHTDQVCQQLNACAYLDDVPPRGGGFTVYPGSHKALFHAHRFSANWSPLPHFGDVMRQVIAETTPLELAGHKGDVIFWHGRTVHSSGPHFGKHVRWAVFADFMHEGETLTDDEHRALGLFEWFKDTKLLRHDVETAAGTGQEAAHGRCHPMWRGWRLTPC